MFQNLRSGAPFYVFYKDAVNLETGEVVSVSLPVLIYSLPLTNIYTPPKTTVDVRIKVGNKTLDFQKIPSELSIADFGNNDMVISEDKNLILQEIEAYCRKSEEVVKSVDKHQDTIAKCQEIVKTLSPISLQEVNMNKEIDSLKCDIRYIKDALSQIMNNKKENYELDRNLREEIR